MFLACLLFGGVTITLSPEARVRGAEIELGAIATVEGEDADQVARVRALKLGYAPAPGYSRVIAAARVAVDVKRMVANVEVTTAGAAACRVTPQTEVITGAQLADAARAEIVRWTNGRDAEFSLVAALGDLEIPSGEKSIDVRAVLSESVTRAGPINVPVRVTIDGQLHRTVWSNWTVTLFEEVNVLKSPLRAGDLLTPELFERKRVAITSAEGPDAPAPLGLTAGARAARDMPAGATLRLSDMSRSTLVKRGDTLFLEIRRGSITARVAANADEDGRAGDRIRVTLIDTGKSMNAVVRSRDLAVIDLANQG